MSLNTPKRTNGRPRPLITHRPLDTEIQIGTAARESIDQLATRLSRGLPMMFDFAADCSDAQTYEAVGVAFKPPFLDFLQEIEKQRQTTRGNEQGRLPTTMLRLLLGTYVPSVLRIETNLWQLANMQPRLPLLISSSSPQEVGRAARKALALWVLNIPDLGDATRALLEERVADNPIEFATIAFDPSQPGERCSHRDLADLAAYALEGHELFPGRGPLRRVVSKDTSSNVAELMTDPFLTGARRSELPTSFVVKLRTKTFAGERRPRLIMDVSRRQWTDNASTYLGKVTLYALPARTQGNPNPGAITLQIDCKQHLLGIPALDYVGLRQRYPALPETSLKDRRVVPELLSHPDCQVVAVARQGRGVKGGATGAPDLDRFLAFAIAAADLKRYGLQPWDALEAVGGLGSKEGQTPEEPFQALFAEPKPTTHQIAKGTAAKVIVTKKKAADEWIAGEQQRIETHYGHPYRLLLLHADLQDRSAARAAEILTKALGDRIVITRQAMPPKTSGPKGSLPEPEATPEERAALRHAAWAPFLNELQETFDGTLLVVPQGEGETAEDPVNKRAAKIAILKGLKVHAQYLRPIEDDKEETDFIRRTIRAFQDLAWESLGILTPIEDHTGEFGGESVQGRILALSIATVNSTRDRKNKPTTVPMGLRLDLQTQQTEAQLLLPAGATGWLSLRDATFKLQTNIAKLSPKSDADRKKVQEFFNTLLDEAQEGKQDGRAEVVFLDGDTVSPYWRGLYDKNLEIDDLRFEPREGVHRLQMSWPDLTVLRLRTQDRSAKVLRQGKGRTEAFGMDIPTPRWTESETYVLGEGRNWNAPAGTTFLSVGATNGKLTRGTSGSIKTQKVDAAGKRRELKVHAESYATPEALEVAVLCAGTLGLHGIMDLTSKLRRRYAHYDGWTKQPAPLFFSQLIKNYVPDYGGEGEEDILNLGSD